MRAHVPGSRARAPRGSWARNGSTGLLSKLRAPSLAAMAIATASGRGRRAERPRRVGSPLAAGAHPARHRHAARAKVLVLVFADGALDGAVALEVQPCQRARRACERQGRDRSRRSRSRSTSGRRSAASPTYTKVRRRRRRHAVNDPVRRQPDGVSVVGWGSDRPGARRVDVRLVRAERQRPRDLRRRRHAQRRPTSHRCPTSTA